jgi:hypothetical protein
MVHAACKLNAVYVVIADTVAAYREFVLLRFSLSLTASLSYLPPAFNHFEDRLGKHDVAVSPKLFGLVKIPTGTLVFSGTAFEDIAHTVKERAIEGHARHAPAQALPYFHEGETGGGRQRVFRKTGDKCVQMFAPGGLATFGSQTPNRLLEMNPEILGLFPHQREEHLKTHCVRQFLTFECERREQLPFDL